MFMGSVEMEKARLQRIRKRMTDALEKASGNRVLSSARGGLIYIIPMVTIGSLMQTILNLPIASFQNYLNSHEIFKSFIEELLTGTTGIISIVLVMSVSYSYAMELDEVKHGELKAFSFMIAAVSSFFIYQVAGLQIIGSDAMNSRGILTAFIVTFASINIYLAVYRRLPKNLIINAFDSDAKLSYSMTNVIPMLVTLVAVGGFKLFVGEAVDRGFDKLVLWLEQLLYNNQGSMMSVLIYVLLVQVMWFFGMHGTNLLDAVTKTVLADASKLNIEAATAGGQNGQIVTKEFFDSFVFLGGAGCTLGLLILLVGFSRIKNIKRVGRLSVFPGIFNINEMVVYGLPIIFNPYFLVPFILTPLLISVVSYAAFYFGLVPLVTQEVAWTIPIFMSGYMSTGSVAGIILQLVNLALSVACYLPFLRLYEEHIINTNMANFDELCSMLLEKETESVSVLEDRSGTPPSLFQGKDEISLLARCLVAELIDAFKGGDIEGLHLQFQPKSFSDGRVYGAEALLRWNHPQYGYIPPPVIVALSSQAELGKTLGNWVLKNAFKEKSKWDSMGYSDLVLSVNLSPEHLKTDTELLDYIRKGICEAGLDPCLMELELTEDVAIDQSPATKRKLAKLSQAGIRLAVDDFGMGSSTLTYIKEFAVSVIKIDISLVKDITENHYSQEIVRSIISLCDQFGIEVVAEGVETYEQLEKLKSMGCQRYQGFYFSKALKSNEFYEYLEQHGANKA